jgi:transcriptional regulator GlxA family with amidase domain
MTRTTSRINVCIVATGDSMVSPVTGLFETMQAVGPMVAVDGEVAPDEPPFEVEIVAERAGPIEGWTGLAVNAHRSMDQVEATDVVIVPSMARFDAEWIHGRYPKTVAWIRHMYEGGAIVCSACTGGLLTAETGLLDGHEATIHWDSEPSFRRRHPEVVLRPTETLVVSGEDGRLITSGAATAWHDLALYLVARFVGPATAQALARYQLLEWHQHGQAAFQAFRPNMDHGDAAVLASQRWLEDHHAAAAPVEEMARVSGVAARTFKRRFKAATALSPIAYVQRTRIEAAKQMLETSAEPIEEISWAVGYEDPASFRRLFKRLTGLTPGEYRQRFRLPELAGMLRG